MAMNIIIETVAGSVPLIGDLFDAVWKANAKNMQIVELHYRPTTTPRPLHRILFAFVGFLVAFYLGLFGILYLAFRFLISLFGS